MEFLESKRETNNFLLRQYYGISEMNESKKDWGNKIIKYNLDIIAFVINKYFINFKHNKNIYEIGIVGLINSLERYEMNKFVSFEEFVVSSIKNEIENFINEAHVEFIITKENGQGFNYGDIWYNKTHLLNETIETKGVRDRFTKRLIRDIK